MTTYRSLSEMVSAEYVRAVEDFLATQLRFAADTREQMAAMTLLRLRVPAEEIRAYQLAARDLRDFADRWDPGLDLAAQWDQAVGRVPGGEGNA